MLVKVKIKPLSVNRAFQGRRYRTPEYNSYEKACLLLLPKMVIPAAPYKISYVFGLSSMLSDADNPVKLCNDILQKKYGFNDRDIFELHIKKEKVAKGDEYFAFHLESLQGEEKIFEKI